MIKASRWIYIILSISIQSITSTSTSPPISAKIVTNWDAPTLLVQYLETVSLESSAALFPFIASLTTELDQLEPLLLSSQLQPNETYSRLERHLDHSHLLTGPGQRESLRMALANREASVRVESLFRVHADLVQSTQGESSNCENWLDWYGQRLCTVDEFWKAAGESERTQDRILPVSTSMTKPALYPFDHSLPSPISSTLPIVILYASPSDSTFAPLFNLVYELSSASRLQLVMRWKPEDRGVKERLVLSGYGAGLDIKRVDYIAIDDRLQKANDAEGEIEVSNEEKPKMQPVKKEDISQLGLRATAHILASADPLAALVSLTASFPLLAPHLATLIPEVSADLIGEVFTNQMSQRVASSNYFFLNGIELTDADIDPFALLRLMRKERKVISSILSLHEQMTAAQARELLTFEAPGGQSQQRGISELSLALGEVFDASDREEGGDLIMWWNNLEKDQRYKTWSKSLREMLQPTYPGQMNRVARNLHNVVLVLDLSRIDSLKLISETIRDFVARGIPVRFGLVPQVGKDSDISTMMAQTMWYLTDAAGRSAVMKLFSDLSGLKGEYVSEAGLRAAYGRLSSSVIRQDGEPLAPFDQVRHFSDVKLDQARAYTSRLGVRLSSEPGLARGGFFMNGAYDVVDDSLPQNIQRALGITTQLLQQAIYTNQIKQQTCSTYFYDLPTSYKRRNRFVFPSAPENPLKVVNWAETFDGVHADFARGPYIQGVSESAPGSKGKAPIVTFFVVTDLDSPEGRSLVRAALHFAETNLDSRILLLHNPVDLALSTHPYQLSNLIHHLGSSAEAVTSTELLAWMDLELDSTGPAQDSIEEIFKSAPLVSAWMRDASVGRDAQKSLEYWTSARELIRRLEMKPGESGLIVNGRIVGPFDHSAFASSADFESIKTYELEKRIAPVEAALLAGSFDYSSLSSSDQARMVSFLTSIISQSSLPDSAASLMYSAPTKRHLPYRSLGKDYTSIIGQNEDTALFEIGVVLDPVSEVAQRWAPILRTLSDLGSIVHLRLHLNPNRVLAEVPIKRFFQYSFDTSLRFDETTGLEVPASVDFLNIPETLLLTFATDLQRSWLAFPKQSIYDLDNIRLADIASTARQTGIEAVLELESIIVEGHARDMPTGAPPRGLQLELSSRAANSTVDTIVMANLGYFQLKANPGAWRLSIREGKSEEVFEIESIGVEGMNSPDVAVTGNLLAVTTLEGVTLHPRFRRRAGHEKTELLNDNAAKSKMKSAGVINRFKSIFTGSTGTTDVAIKTRAEINVLTVASGLLYERMAFIMMVSVMRHTKSTVKFWFIQNFLSPSFRAFIPHMALEYGFEYELVTYKWPHWLRAQKEKQRIIWGYKILFLDVLFPIELDRVIFVDSDQIVRTDLKELIEMDIDGCPYAYAPMGDDRKEVEGFRFWKTGYWKNHLRGATYHISALYLVDLDRFRQIAAGDRLRQQYQALSSDPNSLANLDQDLPNFMYNLLPIYTLDKSWLYCETWHSPEALAAAKTIDLCNDPLTHEPKLVRAKRIPEWTVYDDEIAALAQRVAATTSQNEDAIGAFAKRADELEQSRQQAIERDEFVAEEAEKAGSASGDADAESDQGAQVVEGEEEHVRDEL